MLDLSICLVNYNAKDLTIACIESINTLTKRKSFEIILVDNRSGDDSPRIIANKFPAVRQIINERNIGFAAANNQAIRAAQGKFIVLLNNDTILRNNALGKMADLMEQRPQAGIITCKLFNADGKTIQPNCRSFPSPLDTMFGRASLLTKLFPGNPISKKNLLSFWEYDSEKEIDWVSGAAMLIRRDLLNQIGLLDERFFMFWEDTDLCKRAKEAGWQIIFSPAGKIIHLTGRGGGQRKLSLKLSTMFQMHRSAYLYFLKHYFKNPLQPQAILVFLGMIFLVFIKGVREISSAFRGKRNYLS